ncbi:MAG: PQQ-binding-like beta-propeller repeat protein [Bryobacterales bacterium]|nr:PQQ-binding-like beta-propeller repeat protein [Bryobacterales bacterium]
MLLRQSALAIETRRALAGFAPIRISAQTKGDAIHLKYDKAPGFFGFSAPAKDATGESIGNLPCVKPPWERLFAVNANTGDIAWQATLGMTGASSRKTKHGRFRSLRRTDRDGRRSGICRRRPATTGSAPLTRKLDKSWGPPSSITTLPPCRLVSRAKAASSTSRLSRRAETRATERRWWPSRSTGVYCFSLTIFPSIEFTVGIVAVSPTKESDAGPKQPCRLVPSVSVSTTLGAIPHLVSNGGFRAVNTASPIFAISIVSVEPSY